MVRKREIAVKLFSLAVILIFMLAFSLSCDSFLYPKGQVYEWINPPKGENGEIFVSPDKPAEGLNLMPLKDANIAFYSSGGHEYGKTVSDSTGQFSTSLVIAPGKQYSIKIEVGKIGYYPIEKTFTYTFDSHGNYSFAIVMVQEPNAQ